MLQQLIAKAREQKALLLFLGKGFLFLIAWQLWKLLAHDSFIMANAWATYSVSWVTERLIALLAPDTLLVQHHGYENLAGYVCKIYSGGRYLIGIANPCNGLSIQLLFLGFVAAFPGLFWDKLRFAAIGSLSLFFVNVLRVGLLAGVYRYLPNQFQLHHKFTFMVVVYGLVIVLWWYWAQRNKPLLHAAKT